MPIQVNPSLQAYANDYLDKKLEQAGPPPRPADLRGAFRRVVFDFGARTAAASARATTYEQLAAVIESYLHDQAYGPMIATAPGIMTFAARWAGCAFPCVVVGHRLAASMMSTSIAPQDARDVKFPWPAFEIKIPRGLISVATPTGDPRMRTQFLPARSDALSVYVHRYVQHGADTLDLIVECEFCELQSLGNKFDGADIPWLDDGSRCVDFTDEDRRVMACVNRLVFSTCLEMSRPEAFKPQNRAARMMAAGSRSTPPPVPELASFVLTRDVKLDVRKSVSDFIAGTGSAPTVNVLVRGHWKRQAHGPGGASRKWIHIEPYWRGPEDAPTAIRSHRMDPTEGGGR